MNELNNLSSGFAFLNQAMPKLLIRLV